MPVVVAGAVATVRSGDVVGDGRGLIARAGGRGDSRSGSDSSSVGTPVVNILDSSGRPPMDDVMMSMMGMGNDGNRCRDRHRNWTSGMVVMYVIGSARVVIIA